MPSSWFSPMVCMVATRKAVCANRNAAAQYLMYLFSMEENHSVSPDGNGCEQERPEYQKRYSLSLYFSCLECGCPDKITANRLASCVWVTTRLVEKTFSSIWTMNKNYFPTGQPSQNLVCMVFIFIKRRFVHKNVIFHFLIQINHSSFWKNIACAVCEKMALCLAETTDHNKEYKLFQSFYCYQNSLCLFDF